MTLRTDIQETIAKYGHMVIGVVGDPGEPSFAYTIGLKSRFGCELLICGLPMKYAQAVLNDIASKFSKDLLNVPTAEFTNLPVLLKECNLNLGRLHNQYVVQADVFYGTEVKVVQVIMSDREGRTPLDDTYDHEYMGRFQPLFVDFTK